MTEKQDITGINSAGSKGNFQNKEIIDQFEDQTKPLDPRIIHFKTRILETVFFNFHQLHALLFVICACISILSNAFSFYLPVAQELAAGFLIFWMPGYCVMFLLWDSTAFKPIFLFPLTLAFSQAVVITEGAVYTLFGIFWNSASICMGLVGFTLISYILAWKFRKFRLSQPLRLKKCTNFEEFKSRFNLGKIIPKNFGYLLAFIVLIGIFSVVSIPVLKDDDPWYHARILRIIMETSTISFDSFRGAVGLHIFSSAFGFLARWDALIVARWFPIYLVVNGNFAFYLLCYRLFNNAQIANIGTFFVSFTAIGFQYGIDSYWANAIGLGFGLYVIFFLFDANLKSDLPSSRKIAYVAVGLYFSFILRMMHDAIFFNFWISAFFIQLLLGDNRKSQIFKILNILGSLGVFFIFDQFYPSVLFSTTQFLFAFPPVLWIAIVPGAYIGFKFLKKITNFLPNHFEDFIAGKVENAKSFYRFEKRYTKYIIFTMLGAGFLVIYILNEFFTFRFNWVMSLGISSVILTFYAAILGLLVIRRKTRNGQLVFYWGIFFLVGLFCYTLYDAFFSQIGLAFRMAVFSSPAIVLSAIAYVYYVLHSENLKGQRTRKIIFFIGLFGLVSSNLCAPIGLASSQYYDVQSAEFLGRFMTGNSTIIAEFQWDYPIDFFALQNSENNITTVHSLCNYLFPDDIEKNREYLYKDSELYRGDPNASIYLILDSSYLEYPIYSLDHTDFGLMSYAQVEKYTNINYLNRIYGYNVITGDWMMMFALV